MEAYPEEECCAGGEWFGEDSERSQVYNLGQEAPAPCAATSTNSWMFLAQRPQQP